jgi:hypothetical protein
MDRQHQPHQHADPALKPDLGGTYPRGVGSPDRETIPSTQDIREAFLRRRVGTATAGLSLPAVSRFPTRRRLVAAVGLALVACALLIGLYRSVPAPSLKTASDTTYNTALSGFKSAVSAALELIDKRPATSVTSGDIALSSPKRVTPPRTRTPGAIASSPPLDLLPLVSADAARAVAPDPIGGAHIDVTPIIYSPDDTDVSPPVAIRSPGLAANHALGDHHPSLIEILVSETGGVESAREPQRPATLGAALQSATALSVVKTWRFSPARRNGEPVKYRTTVPFVQTMNPAGMLEGNR